MHDPVPNFYPLTLPQRDIWFDQLLHPGTPIYHIGGYMHLRDHVDIAVLELAVNLLFRKHDVLRTVFQDHTGSLGEPPGLPVQCCLDTLDVAVPFHDLSSHGKPDESARTLLIERFMKPFDLQAAPLCRFELIKLGDELFYLFLSVHHLIADGWSVALLIRSLGSIYTALVRGGPPNLAAPSYSAFSVNDESYRGSAAFEGQRQYWVKKFESAPEPLLSAGRRTGMPADAAPSQCRSMSLSRDWYDRLTHFARGQGVATFHVILAAVYVYFTRTAQRRELVLGLPVHNRGTPAFKATAGLFTGVMAARFSFGLNLSFGDLLRSICRELKRNYRHQRFPVGTLNRELGRVGQGRPRLFDIGVSYERHDHEAVFGEARGAAIPLINGHQTHPLMLYVREFHDDEPVEIDFVFHKAYFDDEIAAIQQRLVALLDLAQQAPDMPIHSMPVLSRDESACILHWNRTRRDNPAHAGVLDPYDGQVRARPGQAAVIARGAELSYGELDKRANQLARFLVERYAVGPDTLVGLCMERSAWMIVGMLSIIKAGGAYVPLDPSYPARRLLLMLEDTRLTLLITQQALVERLPPTQARLLCLDSDWPAVQAGSDCQIESPAKGANLAYVIYTSGSTGEPKGVAVSRDNLLHSTRARQSCYVRPVERFLMPSSIAFDSSVAGIFWSLSTGGTLCLPAEDEHNDPAALARLVERHAATHLLCIPSFHALLLQASSGRQLASLSTVIVAGEACSAELVADHDAVLPHAALFNEYGPTEGSVWSTVHRCEPLRGGTVVPIGRPIDDVQVHLLDEWLQPAPIGVPAEMYLAGEGLARGYPGRPDATAEKFIPCPFSERPGERMYRTGDLGRWRSDGSIEFLGRVDRQLKVRGFRVEPGDIESALLAMPSVQEAAVVVPEDHSGATTLVAYVTLRDAVQTHVAVGLKEALGNTLPRHMVPDHIVVLEQMPRTPNGKLDRKALPVVRPGRGTAEWVAPRTHTEAMLADIWAEVMSLDKVSARDNFFDLGGHSLLAGQVVAGLRKTAGVEIPLRAVFEAPVLQDLAQRVDAAFGLEQAGDDVRCDFPAPRPVDRRGALPLSFGQRRLWFLGQLETGNPFYNVAGGMQLTGTLDLMALEGAMNSVVARHEILRTTFEVMDDEVVQKIASKVRLPFAATDLSGMPPHERDAEATRLALLEAAHPFNLLHAPLMRVHVLRLEPQRHSLLLTMHHIVADGWSMGILLRELAAFYNGHVSHTPVSLPELVLQYADFAAWQHALPRTEQWERELGYWRRQLADAPGLLQLPADRPRPAVQSHRGAHIGFALPPDLGQRLHVVSRESGATLFMTLIGAFGLLLSRYSGQDDLSIGTPVAGRRHAEFESLIGCFVNMLPLRFRVNGGLSFNQWMGQVRETALAAYAHQDVPFEQLVEALQPERALSHSPLFQVMFVLHNNASHAAALDGVEALASHILPPVAKFDLSLSMWEDGNRVHGLFEYSTDLFDHVTVEGIARHFQMLLSAVAERPDAPVATLDVLATGEREALLQELGRSYHEFPLNASYATLFGEQASRHSERIAAVCMGESLSYGELDRRSTRIAHALTAAGAGPDVLVGTMGERGLCYLVMMIAILKSGAAYVPLDIRHPVGRLREIVSRGRIRLFLVSETSVAWLDPLLSGLDAAPVTLVAERLWLHGDTSALPRVGSPDDLAYVIFTSGSTGQPKGAMVESRGMLNNLYGKVPALALGPGDRVAQTASPAFDISVWQFLAAPLLGGTVHILPDPVVHDPQRLLDALAEQRVSVLQLVPSMMRQLLAAPMAHLPLSLRWVLSIGETLPPTLARAWFERYPAVPLINIYGPAECADNVAFHALHSAQEAQSFDALVSVPIGRATANMQLFVMDGLLQPVPVGVPGEICIGGPGVGRGYLNDPEATRKVFVDHPFQPGARFYRSGDRGRLRADGVIEYLGRCDHQIKIRGQRIELGEIESRLQRHPGVREAVVVVREDTGSDGQIVAYWVPRPKHSVIVEDLRRDLSDSLPHYMVPARFVMLDGLPLNANGKVDRKAIAALPWLEEARHIDTPCGAVEQQLAMVWASLLRKELVGRHENFFHLGGHSLLATRLTSQIRKMFDVELPLRAVFESPTLRELAGRIAQAKKGLHDDEPPMLPVGREGPLPLSFAQRRLWFLEQLESGRALYNMSAGLRLTGALDADALEGAVNDIVRRHEVLRTAFDAVDGHEAQQPAAGAPLHLPVTDLRSLQAEQREVEALRLARAEAQRPFDLRRAPLLRARLLRLDAVEHWLLLTVHHIVFDGWSADIVLRELAAFYQARRRGVDAPLPALPVQYADFAAWQRARLRGACLERHLDYWRAQLEGAPTLMDLPTDHPRPAAQAYRGGRFSFRIDDALTAGLHAVGHGAGATLFMALSSTFALLLARLSGQEDVCIGTPVANRDRPEVADLIGFFVNTLVLRIRPTGKLSFAQLLQQTRETALAAYAHQDMPFEQLVEALQPERHLSHSPLFQVMFVLQHAQAAQAGWDGLQAENLEFETAAVARFDLTLHVVEREGFLDAAFEFNGDLFERASVMRFSRYFLRLLEALVSGSQVPIGELPLMSPDELHQVLVEWNRTHVALPSRQTIHELFESCVADHADKTAVVFEDERLSYAELNAKANRLAHYLRAQGVGADELVCICIDRSPQMIVAILGVLKAGGAYLPLDPALPSSRLSYMMDDARPCFMLTQAHLLGSVQPTEIGHLCLDRDADELTAWPDHNPGQQTLPRHLAYAIYTSGSTGRPKGTLLHHRALVNLVLAQQRAFGLRPCSRVLQWASFNFDASVSEIFMALTAGAQLHLASKEALLPGPKLFDTLRRHCIELVTLTPSSLSVLPLEPLPALKTLVVAGERCDHALIAPWLTRYTVINAYGPTEATVCATVYPCAKDGQRRPPIGRPIANTRIYVLDAFMNPVPVGVTGELYVGGEGVARGYLGRPDLTAERFIQDPFSDQDGARMYNTGDLVRYLPDGMIEYIGRADHQVKIRGYRIELGEIEFALAQQPAVREAVVLAQDAAAGGAWLVAFVTLTAGNRAESAATALRAALGLSLPEYMVPAQFVFLERLPVNANGKIDRQALDVLVQENDVPVPAPLSTPTEQRLAAIWCEVLARRQVGRDDNFFHIGGHSLLAVRLVTRLNDVFQLAIPLSQLFLSPSIATLAAAIERRQTAAQLVVPLRDGEQGASMWFIHPAGGTVFCYWKLAAELDGRLPVYAIQSPEAAGWDAGAWTFDLLCRRYASEIVLAQPEGTVYLAGWSLGGALAFGVAGILEREGRGVGWVAMFDTMAEGDGRAFGFEDFVIWALTQIQPTAMENELGAEHMRAAEHLARQGTGVLRRKLSENPDSLTHDWGLERSYVDFLTRQYRVHLAHIAMMAGFSPGTIAAPLHVFRAEASQRQDIQPIDWMAHTDAAAASTLHTLPGSHENIILLDTNVRHIAQVLSGVTLGQPASQAGTLS